MSENANKDTLNQAVKRFNAEDLDGYLQMFQPAVLHHGFSRNIGPGVTGLRNFYRQMIAAFPDARIQTEDLLAGARNSLIATRSTAPIAPSIWDSLPP
jgi:hypothetical protein